MLSDDDVNLWRQWRDAANDDRVSTAVRSLYDRLDAAVRARGPTCWTSGKCCNFDAYGHRLYVTGLEIAWLLAQLQRQEGRVLPAADGIDLRGPCVLQEGGLCSVHTLRPLGCRVFFCQQGTQDWQQETYEHFLTELRALHDAQGLPYRYMEWRAGLREALLAMGV